MGIFMEHKKGYAIVTGASAGIGADIAEQLADRGYNLLLVARRGDRLRQLATQLRDKHSVKTDILAVDLSEPAAVAAIKKHCTDSNYTVDVLVCNAGYSIAKLFHNTSEAEEEAFIRVLSTSVIMLCKRFIPDFIEQKHGHIMIVSSLAGFAPPATGWGALYGPIKTFMNSVSAAFNANYNSSGITSTAVCPGFTRTEFHQASGLQEAMDKIPNFMKQDSKQVAKGAVDAMLKRKHIWLPGKINNLIRFLCWLLPMPLILAIAHKLTGGRYERQD